MYSNTTLKSNESFDDFFNNCPNALSWRILLLDWQSLTYALVVSVVIIPTVITNALLFVGMYGTRQSNSSCNLYICVSAIFGVLSGITGFPMYVVLFTLYQKERVCVLERVATCTTQFNAHAIGYAILALAVDRYFSVKPDLSMRAFARLIHSKLVSRIVVAVFATLSLLHGLVSVDYFTDTRDTYGKLTMMTANVLIVLVVYYAYIKLYCDIKVHDNSFRSVLSSVEDTRTHCKTKTPRYLREFIKTISIILVTGVICYIPFIAMDIWTGYYTFGKKTASPQTVRFMYYISSVGVFLNTSINAALFLYRNKKAWIYVKSLCLSSKRRRAGTVESTPMSRFRVEREANLGTHFGHHVYSTGHSDASPCLSLKSTPILRKATFIIEENSPQLSRSHLACI